MRARGGSSSTSSPGRASGSVARRRRLRAQRSPSARESPAMSIRVLIADDQSMVRAGFRMLLSGEPDIDVVAEASNGLEAVEKTIRYRPTVVLMDIRMPELDGLEATRRILAADDTARILILTPRSGKSSTSAIPPSRLTSRTSCRSSTCATASRQLCWRTRREYSPPTAGLHRIGTSAPRLRVAQATVSCDDRA